MQKQDTDRKRSVILRCLLCLVSAASLASLSLLGCQGPDWANDRLTAQDFREGWTSVPRSFRGDDIAALARVIGQDRDEFETDAAYSARLRGAAERKYRYVFCVDPAQKGMDGFGVRYDADREQFEVKVSIGWDSSMLLAKEEIAPAAGRQQPAFGSGPRTTDLVVESYSLRLVNESLAIVTPTDKVIYEGVTKYPLTDAPNFKGRIKMLVVARLAPVTEAGNPYYEREYSLSEATVVRPVNINEYSHFLGARLDSIWVYDGLTGLVIGKHHLAPEDENVVLARRALADGSYYTALAMISKLPGGNPVVHKIKQDIEAMRLENADEEQRRLLEDVKNEKLRNHGPEPDPAVVKKFIQKLVPTLVTPPCEVTTISSSVKSLATVNGELRAAWQVRAEVKSKKGLSTSYLYVYFKYDEIIGFDLI